MGWRRLGSVRQQQRLLLLGVVLFTASAASAPPVSRPKTPPGTPVSDGVVSPHDIDRADEFYRSWVAYRGDEGGARGLCVLLLTWCWRST
jgi:hypothetical protein